MFFEAMHASWQKALVDQRPLLEQLEKALEVEVAEGHQIAPPISQVMAAFRSELSAVKVLIAGQDPYPTFGHAIGLSFAVSPETKPLPKSLKNMMLELQSDLPEVSAGGDLRRWVDQGVLLLNRHLTTRVGLAGAHGHLGWEQFTDAVIAALGRHNQKLVAVLWGNQAAALERLLSDAVVLKSAHPSPLSAYRGFFGSKPFSRVNSALNQMGLSPIDWSC